MVPAYCVAARNRSLSLQVVQKSCRNLGIRVSFWVVMGLISPLKSTAGLTLATESDLNFGLEGCRAVWTTGSFWLPAQRNVILIASPACNIGAQAFLDRALRCCTLFHDSIHVPIDNRGNHTSFNHSFPRFTSLSLVVVITLLMAVGL